MNTRIEELKSIIWELDNRVAFSTSDAWAALYGQQLADAQLELDNLLAMDDADYADEKATQEDER